MPRYGTLNEAYIATFGPADLESLLDLRTLRRVERQDNLEVWGER